jgi:phospholipase C
MSWVDEISSMQKVASGSYVHYVGTFLHEPVDMVSGQGVDDLFYEQVVQVDLTTDSAWDPGGLLRHQIRNQIYDGLSKVDAFTKRSLRDDINSMVTSWLLGGVADDEHNIDENNIVIEDVSPPQAAQPELGVDEDTLTISYRGPRKVFVPQAPADWPKPDQPNPAHDFSPGTLANIDHIVVLMKENRSFDHLLGYLSLPEDRGGMGRQDVDGLTGDEVNIYKGTEYRPFEWPTTVFFPGPPNDYESVQRAINGGHMDGFVRSQADAYGDDAAGRVMAYHTGAAVPQFDALARDFAIGHRWFASHPGPTFPNRFYELTGRPNLDARGFWEFENSHPMLPVFTPTIFDYLDGAVDPRSGAPYTWRYFEHAYCMLRFFEGYTFDHKNVVGMDDPVDGFFACAQSGQLPNVSFIDPHFLDYPPDSNCDEPPSDIAAGQDLVQRIVEAVVASPAWNRTLLFIVYDEHGGFYDHVPPPPAPRVSPELPIDNLGVRVPAFVISPWVAAGSVFGHDAETASDHRPRDNFHFDHTSILKTIVRRFLNRTPPYMGTRFAAAHDLSEVIGNDLRQPQFLPYIRYRLEFVRSQMLVTVQQADRAPGTAFLQSPPPTTATVAQDLSFEDAGDGLVYIRSHVSNLYLTAQGQDAIVQDRRYVPPDAEPERQRWRLSPVGITVLDRDLYVISNEAYPGLLLQPGNPSQPGSLLALGDAGESGGVHRQPPNTWRVSSPCLPNGSISSQ